MKQGTAQGPGTGPVEPRLVEAGILLVDKPAGLTSHDVVARGRRLAKTRRVGHAGTLDPMATGVLVLGINSGTKLLQYVSGAAKTYLATIRLGISTNTDDAEGEIIEQAGCPPLSRETIDRALETYRGEILQVPTTVSAIKVDGKRAYALARAGKDVKLEARPIVIHRFEVIGEPAVATAHNDSGDVPVVDVDVVVECSSGTYIRALARDLGRDLGVGGHLTALRRTVTGPWKVEQCHDLEDLFAGDDEGEALPLIPLDRAARTLFPTLVVTGEAAARFRNGQAPGSGEVVDVLPGGSANPKFPGIRALVPVGDQSHVLGLVRVVEGTTLDLKTVSVFAQ